MSWVTIVPVAPMRAEASHRSEMVSQLLFGEQCFVLEEAKDFVRVKCHYDGYEGWVQRSQLAESAAAKAGEHYYITAFNDEVLINGQSCIVPHASEIWPQPWLVGGYEILPLSANYSEALATKGGDIERLVREYAFRYLNTAYLWGGKSVYGVDCSGFAQQVFKMAGIWLPRDSGDQAKLGEVVEFLQAARLGDLAFFDNEEGKIIHVGIMLNEQEILHASGYVHVDKIDNEGIMHHITGARTHRLRIIKRFF